MVAHTAEIPEAELEQMGEESFSFISKEYMNFSIRLGYHLSVVEAYTGENINDNYIRFFFKGGGASRERRLRRVRLISEILKKIDFRVKVIEDVIDAMITKTNNHTLKKNWKSSADLPSIQNNSMRSCMMMQALNCIWRNSSEIT